MRAKLATERGDPNASESLAVKFMRELGGPSGNYDLVASVKLRLIESFLSSHKSV